MLFATHRCRRSPAANGSCISRTCWMGFDVNTRKRTGWNKQTARAGCASMRRHRTPRLCNCRIGYRKPTVDDGETLTQLSLGNAQRRIREEIIPPDKRKETVLPEEISECGHLRRCAVEWRHRFPCLLAAHELDDPEQSDRSDSTHRWMPRGKIGEQRGHQVSGLPRLFQETIFL